MTKLYFVILTNLFLQCSVYLTSQQPNADTKTKADDESRADKVEAIADDITFMMNLMFCVWPW